MPIKTKKPIPDNKKKSEVWESMEIGKDQYNLEFICALGDPSRMEKGKKKDSDTGKVTPKTVGAKFRVLSRLQIPESPPQEDFAKNLMSFDKDDIQWVWHEAGDIVNLTPFEYGLLLSQPNFNTFCLGGDRPVCLTITSARKDKGALNAITKLPRVTLRPYGTTQTYKDTTIEPVLECKTVIVNELTGQRKKVKTIIEGYEKWEPLTIQGESKRGRKAKSKTADPTKTPNEKAKTYLEMLNTLVDTNTISPEEEEFDD